jgi:hypothetical protein
MGEIADWYLEKMMFPFDGDDDFDIDTYANEVKCKHCGTTEVYWGQIQGIKGTHYRLFNNGTNIQHFCNVVSDDEFDNLT